MIHIKPKNVAAGFARCNIFGRKIQRLAEVCTPPANIDPSWKGMQPVKSNS
jgi:hypothetical protein